MTFSDRTIADYLNRTFESAWINVRPVPIVEAHHPDGRVEETSFNGNVLTHFCTPDGRVFDILPGVVSPAETLSRARLASELWELFRESDDQAATVAQYHDALAEGTVPRDPIAAKRVVAHDRVRRTLDAPSVFVDTTRHNRTYRYPRVHRLLARRPLATFEQIKKEAYRDILLVDLDDPFLGADPALVFSGLNEGEEP